MGILQAENNVSYVANNACKIYIIKQEAVSNKDKFEADYASLIGDPVNPKKFLNLKNAAHSGENDIKLVRLIDYPYVDNSGKLVVPNKDLYTAYDFIENAIDKPEGYYKLWFLTSLVQLRNCPLIDFSKLAYVFQIEGQSQGGLANVVSFNTTFSVNGQSSAELVINNKDFKYNFKYFSDKEKYPFHLKSYFDTNDIIIIRYQKKNLQETSLLNSFKKTQKDYWRDPYIESESDPFTTIFTGYINDINNSFSFSNGQQQLSITCTGPSKKLTWTRFLSNKAAASKDSLDAILPISAFKNTQTNDENNKTNITNADVIKNVIIRTYSGVLNIPEVKENYDKFVTSFDKYNSILTDLEYKSIQDKLRNEKDTRKIQNYQQQLVDIRSKLAQDAANAKNEYNTLIFNNMSKFSEDNGNLIGIKRHSFLNTTKFGKTPYIFVINGTEQPAYQWSFNDWSSLFKSDFSTVYQFIKGIADNLQFNFYDDPYGTIHFSVPDMSLMHLYNSKDPNNLNQIINFSETQNTENIANVQYAEASYVYNLPLAMINTVAKDYLSIQKYGEKMMQPFSMVGITNEAALRYAARMRMAKYNRKALSNIRVTLQGEPCLKMDQYAYIKSLRKLFYIESYSHSYTAGDNLTTSLNGTYTRDILCLLDLNALQAKKVDTNSTNKLNLLYKNPLDSIGKSITDNLNGQTFSSWYNNKKELITLEKQLEAATTIEDTMKVLNQIEFPEPEILQQIIYQMFVDNWYYPPNNDTLKQEIGALYNADSLRYCYLDGFLWAIPFDADPYQMANQIQEEEKAKVNQLSKTINTKSVARNNISNKNKIDTKNIQTLNKITSEATKQQLKQAINEYNIIKNGGMIIKAAPESSIPYTELNNGVRIYDYSKMRKSLKLGAKFDTSKLDIRKDKTLDLYGFNTLKDKKNG